MEFDNPSNRVIGCAIEVHREHGPGLLESIFEQCLAHELRLHEIEYRKTPAGFPASVSILDSHP